MGSWIQGACHIYDTIVKMYQRVVLLANLYDVLEPLEIISLVKCTIRSYYFSIVKI